VKDNPHDNKPLISRNGHFLWQSGIINARGYSPVVQAGQHQRPTLTVTIIRLTPIRWQGNRDTHQARTADQYFRPGIVGWQMAGYRVGQKQILLHKISHSRLSDLYSGGSGVNEKIAMK
jgi:hypothetical protein